jgi:hypothetical protein
MRARKTERESAQELYEHRHDPGEWSEKAVRIKARPARTAVISCRLPLDEYNALDRAAQESGESLSDFVRKSVAMLIGVRSPAPQIVVATGIATESAQVKEARNYYGVGDMSIVYT